MFSKAEHSKFEWLNWYFGRDSNATMEAMKRRGNVLLEVVGSAVTVSTAPPLTGKRGRRLGCELNALVAT